jgi:acyl carrier protein
MQRLHGSDALSARSSPDGVEAAARLRELLATHLGVGPEAVTPDVSLTDDLAADSLDMVDIGLALETELGVVIGRRELDGVRTFGDLLALVSRRTARQAARSHPEARPILARTRIVRAGEGRQADVQRSGLLTPYAAQLIGEDALRAGAGTLLDVRVGPDTDGASIAATCALFAWLVPRGVRVVVRRDLGRPA